MERHFFERSPVEVGPDFLGTQITVDEVTMRIVEVEAYLGPHDQAAHSFSGKPTKRTAPMFGPPGHLYVYFTYGMHHCMNIVCGHEGEGYGLLLRGAEIISGHDLVAERRFGCSYAALTGCNGVISSMDQRNCAKDSVSRQRIQVRISIKHGSDSLLTRSMRSSRRHGSVFRTQEKRQPIHGGFM